MAERIEARAEANAQRMPGLVMVALLALFAALVFVVISVRANRGAVADPYGYGEIARGFTQHGFDKVTRRGAMLYPHMLWGIYELGGSDYVALALNVLMHVGTCILVVAIGRPLFNSRTGLIAGLVAALHPMLLRYLGELHTEALLVFLCTLTVWCAIRFDQRSSAVNGVILGAVGMTGVLTKGVLLPVLVAYGAVWFVRSILRRKRGGLTALPGLIALGLTMVAIVTPWTVRNYRVSGGRFVLLTPGSPDAFLRGYIFTRLEFATLQQPPYTVAENESNALFQRIAREAGTTWEVDEMQDDVNNGREAARRIREQPLDTVRKVFVGLFTFWYEMTSLKNSLVPASLAIIGWVLAAFGFSRAREEQRSRWLLLLPIVVMNVLVAALIPLGRYSVPIIPCLSLLAAFGVDTLLRRRTAAT